MRPCEPEEVVQILYLTIFVSGAVTYLREQFHVLPGKQTVTRIVVGNAYRTSEPMINYRGKDDSMVQALGIARLFPQRQVHFRVLGSGFSMCNPSDIQCLVTNLISLN